MCYLLQPHSRYNTYGTHKIFINAIMLPLLLALLPTLAFAQAEIDVDVGKHGLNFEPPMVMAGPGTKINFHFYPGDHSVAQSTYDNPCVPSGTDPIYSGFVNPSYGEASKMFTINITDTSPIWIYCSQSFHCSAGMAMVINPP